MNNSLFRLGVHPSSLPAFTKENIDKVPERSGVYILYEPAGPFYVGRSSVNMRARLRAHCGGYGSRNVRLAMRIRQVAHSMTFTYVQLQPGCEREVEAVLIPMLGTTRLANMRHEGLYEVDLPQD